MNAPVGAFLIITLLAVCGFAIAGGGDNVILSLALLPSVLAAAVIVFRKDRDLLSPLHMLLYMLFIGVFIKAYYLLHLDVDGESQMIVLAGLDHSILFDGAVLFNIATVAALAGFLLVRPVTRPDLRSVPVSSLMATRVFAVLAFVIGAILTYFFIDEMGIDESFAEGVISAKRVHEDTVGDAARGAAFGYLRMGAQTLPQVAFYLHAINLLFHKRVASKVDWAAAVLVGALSLVLPFLTSSRTEMIYLGIIFAIIYHFAAQRLSVSKAALVLLMALVALTVLGQLRVLSTSNNEVRSVETEEISVQALLKASVGKAYFMDIGKTSVIVDAVPSRVDYLYGKSLVLFVIGPIPRTWWPDKPAVRIGLFVGQEVFRRDNASGVPPGLVGELYMNFGYPGVVIGMLAYGWFAAFFYRRMIQQERTPMKIVIYALGSMVLAFTLLTIDVTAAMSQVFRYGMVLFVFSLFFRGRWKQKVAAPAMRVPAQSPWHQLPQYPGGPQGGHQRPRF